MWVPPLKRHLAAFVFKPRRADSSTQLRYMADTDERLGYASQGIRLMVHLRGAKMHNNQRAPKKPVFV